MILLRPAVAALRRTGTETDSETWFFILRSAFPCRGWDKGGFEMFQKSSLTPSQKQSSHNALNTLWPDFAKILRESQASLIPTMFRRTPCTPCKPKLPRSLESSRILVGYSYIVFVLFRVSRKPQDSRRKSAHILFHWLQPEQDFSQNYRNHRELCSGRNRISRRQWLD